MTSCSHCHNLTSDKYCPNCGHNAEVARVDCDCSRCRSLATTSSTEPKRDDSHINFGGWK